MRANRHTMLPEADCWGWRFPCGHLCTVCVLHASSGQGSPPHPILDQSPLHSGQVGYRAGTIDAGQALAWLKIVTTSCCLLVQCRNYRVSLSEKKRVLLHTLMPTHCCKKLHLRIVLYFVWGQTIWYSGGELGILSQKQIVPEKCQAVEKKREKVCHKCNIVVVSCVFSKRLFRLIVLIKKYMWFCRCC